jgi:hypothetical protein
MRIVFACLLAVFVSLAPYKLHAFEQSPESSEATREALRTIAEPSVGSGRDSSTSPAERNADAAADDKPRVASHEKICATLASAALENDLPVIFLLRLIWQESRFDPLAISHAGASGVAQFMPKIARAIGLSDPFDPTEALPASAKFLRELHEKFGNLGLAAAAYNAGTRRIREWLTQRGKLPRETRDYVMKITGMAPEFWAKTGADEIELKMPPVACRQPETLTIPTSERVVFTAQPAAPAPSRGNTEVSAAAKTSPKISAERKKSAAHARRSMRAAARRHSASSR